jgi:hypothetical protein
MDSYDSLRDQYYDIIDNCPIVSVLYGSDSLNAIITKIKHLIKEAKLYSASIDNTLCSNLVASGQFIDGYGIVLDKCEYGKECVKISKEFRWNILSLENLTKDLLGAISLVYTYVFMDIFKQEYAIYDNIHSQVVWIRNFIAKYVSYDYDDIASMSSREMNVWFRDKITNKGCIAQINPNLTNHGIFTASVCRDIITLYFGTIIVTVLWNELSRAKSLAAPEIQIESSNRSINSELDASEDRIIHVTYDHRDQKEVNKMYNCTYILSSRGAEFNPNFELTTDKVIEMLIPKLESSLANIISDMNRELSNVNNSNRRDLLNSQIKLTSSGESIISLGWYKGLFKHAKRTNEWKEIQYLLRSCIAKLNTGTYLIIRSDGASKSKKIIIEGKESKQLLETTLRKPLYAIGVSSKKRPFTYLDIVEYLISICDVTSGREPLLAPYSKYEINPTKSIIYATSDDTYIINKYRGAKYKPADSLIIREQIKDELKSNPNDRYILYRKALSNPIFAHLWLSSNMNDAKVRNDQFIFQRFMWLMTYLRVALVFVDKVYGILVVHGDTGTGKSTLFDTLFRLVLGDEYVFTENNKTDSPFNGHLIDKLAYISDDSIKDTTIREKKITLSSNKAIGTNRKIQFTKKFLDSTNAKNRINVIIILNDALVLYVDIIERRYMFHEMFHPTTQADAEIYNRSIEIINNPNKDDNRDVIEELLSIIDNYGFTDEELQDLNIEHIAYGKDIFYRPPPMSDMKKMCIEKYENSITAFKLFATEAAIRGKIFDETDLIRDEGSNVIATNTCYVNLNGDLELRQMFDYELDTMYNTYLWYCNIRNISPDVKDKFTRNFGDKITEVNKNSIINDGSCKLHKWRNAKDRRFRYYFTPGHCIERENMYNKNLDPYEYSNEERVYINNEEIPIPMFVSRLYEADLNNEKLLNVTIKKMESNVINVGIYEDAPQPILLKIDNIKEYSWKIKLFLKLKESNRERAKKMYTTETDLSDVKQMEEVLNEEELEEFYLARNNIYIISHNGDIIFFTFYLIIIVLLPKSNSIIAPGFKINRYKVISARME